MKFLYKAHHFFCLIAILFTIFISGCKKFIEIPTPRLEIVTEIVFDNNSSAISAINGIYSLMMSNQSFTKAGIEEFTGIAGDEFINYSTRSNQMEFYLNNLSSTNTDLLGIFWREPYKYINNANGIIEALKNSNGVTDDVKKQLVGEAKFIRAFCHFYLVNLFGDVPFIKTTDYRINSIASRIPKSDVYMEIINDLLDAKSMLSEDFAYSNNERIRPNKGAATALLARAYLYAEKWDMAELQASEVINNTTTYEIENNFSNVFLIDSKEAIWQLAPVVPGINTPQGQLFILSGPPNSSSRRVSLTNHITNAFELSDNRKIHWVGTYSNSSSTWYFPYKYKIAYDPVVTEYTIVLRLAEQYLIRAEARARQNNIGGSISDLNIIRNRAGLLNTTANDVPSLLQAIEQERRVELLAEWGHRWFDLKRLGKIDAVMSAIKSNWESTDALFPIPNTEILNNPQLTQNPGY